MTHAGFKANVEEVRLLIGKPKEVDAPVAQRIVNAAVRPSPSRYASTSHVGKSLQRRVRAQTGSVFRN